tara:strand:+ start:8099 stop:8215 length:117 start_codon:yes stop_codon:yes gene_type:complete
MGYSGQISGNDQMQITSHENHSQITYGDPEGLKQTLDA